MKSNESTVTWTTAFFIGLGAFLGFLGIATVKALGLGMTFSNSITSSLPEALGRMACVMAVFGLYYLATRKIRNIMDNAFIIYGKQIKKYRD